jgi:hypothetical protein
MTTIRQEDIEALVRTVVTQTALMVEETLDRQGLKQEVRRLKRLLAHAADEMESGGYPETAAKFRAEAV